MIVIISHEGDEHASHVRTRLADSGVDSCLVDTGLFPQGMRMRVEHGPAPALAVSMADDEHDLRDARSVWWRRPRPIALDDQIQAQRDREFAHGECHAAISGLWAALDANWMNDPVCEEKAGHKLYQLKVAAALGWRIPRTLITNDPEQARRFALQEGANGAVYKAFSATELAWRETRLLRPDEHDLLDAVRFAPVIFQEYIRSDIDLRVTVVGDEIFAAEVVTAPDGYRVDYRMSMHTAQFRRHVLPARECERLLALMRKLGLVYGAIDLRIAANGEYVFLEVNPTGQWLFVEERTGQRITDAVAAQLTRWM